MRKFFQARFRVHYTWIMAVLIITWAITTQFSTDIQFWVRVGSGAGASALFFTTIVIRQLILVVLASYKGINVKSVTIFAFGGLLEVDQEKTSPAQELMLALAGILSNLVITCIFYLVYVIRAQTGPIMINVIIKWLAFLYFTLTLFHFLPGYPLEGGRIFRAILWKSLNDGRRATQIVTWTSWTLGLIITVGGIFILVFTIESFTGVFLIVISLILQNAATHSRRVLNKAVLPVAKATEEAA
ncbi:site-2 protease family protein [Chloroflexota bacterium]